MNKIFLALSLSLLARPALGQGPARFHEMTDGQIASALGRIHKERPALRERVEAVSAAFLGTPYKLGLLGEGEDGEFDRDPLYSFRAADCTTFVEHTMALSLEPDLARALRDVLQRIRYRDGKVAYVSRNHFPEVDWIPNNVAAGFIRDVSAEIAGDKVRYVHKPISKRDWYARKTLDDIQGFESASQAERDRRLKDLRSLADRFSVETATVAYVPIEALPEVLARIPSGTIANLVREDKPDKPVLISHQTLLIDKNGAKYVRHAAFGRQVEDVPALEFFYKYFSASWRLLGINLNQIVAP